MRINARDVCPRAEKELANDRTRVNRVSLAIGVVSSSRAATSIEGDLGLPVMLTRDHAT